MAEKPELITAAALDAMSPDERAAAVRAHIVTDSTNCRRSAVSALSRPVSAWSAREARVAEFVSAEGVEFIVHAMPARTKFLR